MGFALLFLPWFIVYCNYYLEHRKTRPSVHRPLELSGKSSACEGRIQLGASNLFIESLLAQLESHLTLALSRRIDEMDTNETSLRAVIKNDPVQCLAR